MNKIIAAIIFLSAFVSCKTDKNKAEPEQQLSKLSSYFENSKIPSAIMGTIDKDGRTEWKAFGPSVWSKKDTITEHHIFRVYSMTKAITAVAALQLVENGLIELDEPLNDILPEMVSVPILKENDELETSETPITLRQLLTHTAGFGYSFTSNKLNSFNSQNWKYEDNPRLFEPGARWHYGTNTDWVGKLIEKISGQDLETYFRKNITEPLEMDNTWFNVPEQLKHKIVSWGKRDSIGGVIENKRIPTQLVTSYNAGGGLFSSPSDYCIFLKCLLNDGKFKKGQILKSESVASLFQNQLPENITLNYDIPKDHSLISLKGDFADNKDTYSFAWALENNDSEKVRPKNIGYWAGLANSYYTLDKSNGIAIVYFTQLLPFNDKESYDFYRLYEKEIYDGIK